MLVEWLRHPILITSLTIVCIAGRNEVWSLLCVVCDSYIDGQLCAEWDRYSFIKNCSEIPMIDPTKPMACRKIHQTVGETTVLRQCSNLADRIGCIDRVGTKGVRTQHCHCDTDLCNAVEPLQKRSFLKSIITSILLCGFFQHIHNV
ncbi:unnamed protein product [Dicrocoelium dendriticum]|nr:unnamed protein product [Dicrocoelium dendriticum]